MARSGTIPVKNCSKENENKIKEINSLETRIEKMQERFNKDLEEIKKSQYIMNNATSEIKKTLWREPTVK